MSEWSADRLVMTHVFNKSKEMATHSIILAWRIPWTEKPGGLQSMGSKRVGHNSLSHTHTHTHTYMLNPDVLLLHTTLPTSLTPNPKFIYVTGTQWVSPFLNCNWAVAVFFFFLFLFLTNPASSSPSRRNSLICVMNYLNWIYPPL